MRLVYKDSEENIPNFDDIFKEDDEDEEVRLLFNTIIRTLNGIFIICLSFRYFGTYKCHDHGWIVHLWYGKYPVLNSNDSNSDHVSLKTFI